MSRRERTTATPKASVLGSERGPPSLCDFLYHQRRKFAFRDGLERQKSRFPGVIILTDSPDQIRRCRKASHRVWRPELRNSAAPDHLIVGIRKPMRGLAVSCDHRAADNQKRHAVFLHHMRVVAARAEWTCPCPILVVEEISC